MSALSAEASQNLAARPSQVLPDIPSPAEGGSLLSLDPDVVFKEYKPHGGAAGSKTIAYLGMLELRRPRQLWRVGERVAGSRLIIGSRYDTFEDLYQRAIQAETEHPAFYRGMELDIAETMEDPSRYSPLDERGVMDRFWIMSAGTGPSHIVHPSNKQPFDRGARLYTANLLSLVIPLHLPPG